MHRHLQRRPWLSSPAASKTSTAWHTPLASFLARATSSARPAEGDAGAPWPDSSSLTGDEGTPNPGTS
eukprot:9102437-Pyramimonas_sp.AAC.1